MKRGLIVHCTYSEKFIEPFIELVLNNFEASGHLFFVRQLGTFSIQPRPNVVKMGNKFFRVENVLVYWRFISSLYRAEKIILHGLFDRDLILLLFTQPWLLKKCYWFMWGGDLYAFQNKPIGWRSVLFEKIRVSTIKRIGHLVTYIHGDYELAKKWYDAKGELNVSLMYPSNLYKEHVLPPKSSETVIILLGNSADPANNHAEVLEKLSAFKDRDILIYCPLSYGSTLYADQVAKLGRESFGDKFVPLIEFMPFEKYLELLGQVDIAVFAHKRQQAMGNTISLLGLGKKVYMRTDVTPWAMFEAMGVKVFDVDKLDLEPMEQSLQQDNQARIKKFFSENALVEQLQSIFER